MLSYKETLDYLYNVAPAFEKAGAGAYKAGLEGITALDNHFGNPHRHYITIHIAGTNGKGSCSHTIAAILQSQGYKTGLYTSPHLADFCERIRVDGEPVSRERVVKFVDEERRFFEPLHPSFFELVTSMAFKYFEERHVDIAVIETGLGGRLDSTNIIRPVLSVITNISFDHTAFLGNTLEAIAREKAGIIKQDVPCLIGEYTAKTRPVFEQVAKEKHAPLFFASDKHDCNLEFQLKGAYQQHNKNTILNAVGILRQQMEISGEAVKNGLARVCDLTGLTGRWQTLRRRPLVICDTGHNLAGWQYLAPQITETAEKRRQDAIRQTGRDSSVLRIVFGMADDKDIDSVIDLLPRNAFYYFCAAATSRAIKPAIILKKAEDKGLRGKAFPSVEEAYRHAFADSSAEDFIFVGGSSYVVANLLETEKY